MRLQKTIARPVAVTGFGYWSGEDVRLEFHPAPPDTGLVFVRADLPDRPRVAARVEHRVEMPRRTVLQQDGVRVEMIEHVLAACAGLQVDNCEIHTDRPEMPGCDGSSAAFVEALLDAGLSEQSSLRPQLVVTATHRLGDDQSWIEVRPGEHAVMAVGYDLEYLDVEAIGHQFLEVDVTPASFQRELSRARTFLREAEAEWLHSRGLGTRVTNSDLLVFGEHGLIGNSLRFADECVRHKILDVVGDLALTGCDVVGRVHAHRSGHRLNADMARLLLEQGHLFAERKRSA